MFINRGLDNLRTLLIGSGGCGKSLMMQHLFLTAAKDYESSGVLPIFLELRHFKQSHEILQFIVETVTSTGETFSEDNANSLLLAGKCQLLFDGFDEIDPSDVGSFLQKLKDCNSLCIRISGKKLGRPKKDVDTKAEKKTAYQDNTDRIEVERKFSLAKRKFGLGLLLTKREDTTKASIVLSIIAMNVDRLAALLLRLFEFVLPFFNFGVQNRDVLEMTGC